MAKITLRVPDYYDLNKIVNRCITVDGHYITRSLIWEGNDSDGNPIFISPVLEHFVNKAFGVKAPLLDLDDSGKWYVKEPGSHGEFEKEN